jgi:YggT family protein
LAAAARDDAPAAVHRRLRALPDIVLALANLIAVALGYLRPALFVAAVAVTGVCGVDWLVRTRRISPFSRVSRFFRSSVDPLMAPIERRLVRGGGLPSHAPWWMLGAVVVGGIVGLSLLEFVHEQLADAALAASGGSGAILRLAVSWVFGILKIALLVRVIVSWLPISPYRWFVRWAFVLSEPMLRPLRAIIPPLGPMDVTPVAAYFLLTLVQWFVLGGR